MATFDPAGWAQGESCNDFFEVGSKIIRWLREWVKPDNHGPGTMADGTRSKSELMLEKALLRWLLIVLERQVKRPQLRWRERWIIVGTAPFSIKHNC